MRSPTPPLVYPLTLTALLLLAHPSALTAAQLRVPTDHTTISAAVVAAAPGDSIRIADCPSDGIGFESSTDTVIRLYDSEVLRNGNGIDLEGTQGIIHNCQFRDNRDDGIELIDSP